VGVPRRDRFVGLPILTGDPRRRPDHFDRSRGGTGQHCSLRPARRQERGALASPARCADRNGASQPCGSSSLATGSRRGTCPHFLVAQTPRAVQCRAAGLCASPGISCDRAHVAGPLDRVIGGGSVEPNPHCHFFLSLNHVVINLRSNSLFVFCHIGRECIFFQKNCCK
jgi:hypothetical protein